MVEVTATRSGDWWAVEIPSPKGTCFTQARRLSQVPEMVKDALATVGVECDEVRVKCDLDPEFQDALDRYFFTASALKEATAQATSATRSAIRALTDHGLTVRDIGELMGLSPQRVSQVARASS